MRSPESFEALLNYLLKIKRRAWYTNARLKGPDGRGDDAGARGKSIRAAVKYLDCDLVALGERKVRDLGRDRSAAELKVFRSQRFSEFFVFEHNPISEQTFVSMLEVCLKLGEEISNLPEVNPLPCPIERAQNMDEDALVDFHSDLAVAAGYHRIDYVKWKLWMEKMNPFSAFLDWV